MKKVRLVNRTGIARTLETLYPFSKVPEKLFSSPDTDSQQDYQIMFESLDDTSLRSERVIIPLILQLLQPQSAISIFFSARVIKQGYSHWRSVEVRIFHL